MDAILVKLSDSEGQFLSLFTAAAKVFSTGSVGFHATGKLAVGEKKYQVNVQIIEIGSKPKPEAGAAKSK